MQQAPLTAPTTNCGSLNESCEQSPYLDEGKESKSEVTVLKEQLHSNALAWLALTTTLASQEKGVNAAHADFLAPRKPSYQIDFGRKRSVSVGDTVYKTLEYSIPSVVHPKEPVQPRLWVFWNPNNDAIAYSSRALHFVDVARGDLIVIDGRSDSSYIDIIANERGIPLDSIYRTKRSDLLFPIQLTQHELPSLVNWLKNHTKSLVLVPTSSSSLAFAEFHLGLRREAGSSIHIQVEGEDLEWAKLFGNKAIVHPRIADGERGTSLWERVVGKDSSGDIVIPYGFICRGKAEIREAWRKLGYPPSYALKEIDSSGGVGVHFIHNDAELDDMDLGYGEIIVEEDLRLRHEKLIFLTIHYEGTTLGPVMEQLFVSGPDGLSCPLYSGSRTISQHSDIVSRIRFGMQNAVNRLQPKHLGGFDIAVGDNSALYLLDINSARFNASHTAHATAKWCFPTYDFFSCFKIKMPTMQPFQVLNDRVEGLDWCMAICYDAGTTARWLVVGESVEECEEREIILRNIMK